VKKDLIFTFTANGSKTLIKWLNIKGNILSIFSNKLHDYHDASYDFEVLLDFKQCNKACPDAPFSFIEDKDIAHKVIKPHAEPSESKWSHYHAQFCDLPLPEDFECFLDQLQKFQNNPEARLNMSKKPAILLNQELMRAYFQKDFPVDLTSDYLVNEDYIAAAKKYRSYYSENKQTLVNEYNVFTKEIMQQINDATWTDEMSEIGSEMLSTFLYTAFLSAIYSFLRETFYANNFQKNKVDWGLFGLTLILIAVQEQTFYPFFAALTMMTTLKLGATLKLVNSTDKSAQLSSIIISSLVSIAESYTFTPFSALKLLLNFMVGLITAVASSMIVGNMTHSFWKPNKQLEAREVTELSVQSDSAMKKTI
jgi:hypothetical protein